MKLVILFLSSFFLFSTISFAQNEIFCPELNQFVGDDFNDDDYFTVNDEVTADCECLGDPMEPGFISVFDVVGREVLTEQYTSNSKSAIFSLGIEELPKGIYTVSADVEGTLTSRKLMVE